MNEIKAKKLFEYVYLVENEESDKLKENKLKKKLSDPNIIKTKRESKNTKESKYKISESTTVSNNDVNTSKYLSNITLASKRD